MKSPRILPSLLLAVSLAACAERPPPVVQVHTSDVTKAPGQMTVIGSATLEVSPDCADVTMTVVADGRRPALSTKAVQDKQAKLVAALQAIGVKSADMKLSTLALEPMYEPNEEGWAQLAIRTYRASITITVETKQFDRIAAIMEAGSDAGASSMSTRFRRSDLPTLKKQVREMALTAAKDKAVQTAHNLGLTLGRVVNVSETSGGRMWSSEYFPQVSNVNVAVTVPDPGVTLGGTMQPLTLDITVGYELAPTTGA